MAASVPLCALLWWSALWVCLLGATFLPPPTSHVPLFSPALHCTWGLLSLPPSLHPGSSGSSSSSGFPALPPLKKSLCLGDSEDGPVCLGVTVPQTSVSSLEISWQACSFPSCLSLEPVTQAPQTLPGQCLLLRPGTPGVPDV